MTTILRRPIPRAPVEGWLTVLMIAVMSVCLAWSLNSAAWVLGRPVLTSFLPYASLGGVAWGFISAKVGWPRWLAQLLGAVFAALLLPIMVGGLLLNGDFTPGPAFVATANSSVEAYLDLAFRGLAFTEQYGHFMLVLGILCWGTAQFASYAVFGHHRPFSAVMISGLALVLNMSITRDEQLAILVWFSLAALVLLIRAHALDERSTWLRHRLGDAGSLSGIYLRAGSAFIVIAIGGALFLTSTASSAPLNGIGNGLDEQIAEATQWIQAVFRGGGAGPRIQTVGFGDSETISGSWVTNDTPILQIAVPKGDSGDYHWRAVTYNSFDGQGWSNTPRTEASVASGDPLLAGTLDDPETSTDLNSVSFTVHALAEDPHNVFTPGVPVSITTDATLTLVGSAPDASLGSIRKGSGDYSVTAEVPIDYATDPAHGLTENQLRVAGTDYPAAVKADYLGLPKSVSSGPATNLLLARIQAANPQANANEYDISKAIEAYLRNPLNFRYNTDVRSLGCTDGVVECFAKTRQGYCEYYASTMVVLLRMLGYPARMAEGYLPSQVDLNGFETIPASAAHAWVEVYFPHYGWIPFDPTGGNVGQPITLTPGPVVTPPPEATPSPVSLASGNGDPRKSFRPNTGDNSGAGSTSGPDSGGGGFVVVGLLLIAIMAALVFMAWQRGPRSVQEPDRVYGGVVGLARRLGFGPRPNQTVYEYAGDLGNILPAARPDLQTVALAKVEVAYGRRILAPERIDALARAQRHLRVVLLGLIFRRSARRAQRRRR
ncbi:MAG TPA: transglutaminaseTgpA domain-containing protein [Candidatus Limnocylindrales bacterium]|nr:transglutaminaseTgpA domain-containing protein [Candidatus Limnocylindrales bacterium]